jgi:hypothetical protein
MPGPASIGSDRLREFIDRGGLSLWFFDRTALTRAFELMELYADHPMDLADASLVTAAEALGTRRVFTLDRKDFGTYRVRRGHRHHANADRRLTGCRPDEGQRSSPGMSSIPRQRTVWRIADRRDALLDACSAVDELGMTKSPISRAPVRNTSATSSPGAEKSTPWRVGEKPK